MALAGFWGRASGALAPGFATQYCQEQDAAWAGFGQMISVQCISANSGVRCQHGLLQAAGCAVQVRTEYLKCFAFACRPSLLRKGPNRCCISAEQSVLPFTHLF